MSKPAFLHHIRRLFFQQSVGQSSDAELLAQYLAHDEDAFTELVRRHGPLVWRICRRMIGDEHLAEDVFQAVFLVLARKASSIRRPDAIGGWLHGVATRLALKARAQQARRKAELLEEEPAAAEGMDDMTIREVRAVLDEELLNLPDKYRYPLVLCYLEGKTRDEAANQLNCPLETLKSRLERGRELLHSRLQKRQLALPAAFLSLLVAQNAASAADLVSLATGTATPRAAALAQGYLTGMKLALVKSGAAVGVLLLTVATAAGFLFMQANQDKPPHPLAEIPHNVFDGPPAPLEPRLRADLPAIGGPLRRLVVEDRVGARRQRELVRVPLFFHDGECRDPHALVVQTKDGNEAIPYQPDDIRRDQDGSVSRMHLYFLVDLEPWQRKEFVLAAGVNPGQKQPPLELKQDKDQITLGGDDLQVRFWIEGPKAGGIADIQSTLGKVSLPDGLLAPRLMLQRQSADLKIVRTSEVSYQTPDSLEIRDLRFGSGPLFAKLVVRVGPKGLPDHAEFTYIVPKHGSQFVQTERLFPDDPRSTDVVGASLNTLLTGRLVLGEQASDQRIVQVPAGLRKVVRSVQGQQNAALVNAQAGLSVLPIPYVQTGMKGIDLGADGVVSFQGTGDFRRTTGSASEDLRAFWGQVRYVFSKATTEEELWELSRQHFQPLTAVVDEFGITADDLHVRLQELMKQFPPHHSRNWMQEAGRLYTLGDQAGLKLILASSQKPEDTLDYWLKGAVQARDALTRNGTVPLKEDDKGRASGPLDPWNLTYGASPAFALAAFMPNERLDRICLAIGQAQRQFNGRVDEHGFPYIDCYNTAFNMQIGSIHAGIQGGKQAGDLELVQFYRDCARSASVLDIYGHGQRTNPSLPKGAAASDLLYANSTDFFLRCVELCTNEDLWLHPAVFGRYFDCIDVNADLCHRTLGESGRTSWHRANFFRGQCHDQYWANWATGPYLGLLARASDQGQIGLSEAAFFSQHITGKRINWTEITTFFHADLALREGLKRYRPEPAPALPAGMQVTAEGGKSVVKWQPVPGAASYRVYRADRMGGPWTLLNRGNESAEAEYADASGKVGQIYFVTAIDAQRRESRWFTK